MITSTLNTSLVILLFDRPVPTLNSIQLALNELSDVFTDVGQKQSNGHI